MDAREQQVKEFFKFIRPGEYEYDPSMEAARGVRDLRSKNYLNEYPVGHPYNPSTDAVYAHESLKRWAEEQNKNDEIRNELAHYYQQMKKPQGPNDINAQPRDAARMELRQEPFRLRETIHQLMTGKSTGEARKEDYLATLLSMAPMFVPGLLRSLGARVGAGALEQSGSLSLPKMGDKAGDVLMGKEAKLRGFDPSFGYRPVEIPIDQVYGSSPQAMGGRIMGQISPELRKRFGLGVDLGEVQNVSGLSAREILGHLARKHSHPVPSGTRMSTARGGRTELGDAAKELESLYRLGIQ